MGGLFVRRLDGHIGVTTDISLKQIYDRDAWPDSRSDFVITTGDKEKVGKRGNELPPDGTSLRARYKGQVYTASISRR